MQLDLRDDTGGLCICKYLSTSLSQIHVQTYFVHSSIRLSTQVAS